ncbi:MAG TPA: YopX family protein [Vitreimonas sp.]|nr:YopX family protein [Vitreimonas sp.]
MKETKELLYPDSFELSSANINLEDKYSIVSFSTGKFDLNGHEIFGGDLVTTPSGTLYKIIWVDNSSMCGWGMMRIPGLKALFVTDLWEKLEIVGNIYENPEILERSSNV